MALKRGIVELKEYNEKWKSEYESEKEFLIEKLDINQNQVMAIGDNMNDKKMIEKAGCGVVMKGSTPAVVEVADYVTDTNNNEGVAQALKKFLL